jgi:excisionase family DNA binding protein
LINAGHGHPIEKPLVAREGTKATLAPCPDPTVARLLAAGKIKAAKLGSRVLVDVASLKAFLAGQPTNTDAPVIKRARSPRANDSRT